MSTYTDLNNKLKETLNVDFHTRVTPQKAHFLNPENTYWGKLKGEINVKGNNAINGGTVTSVLLQDTVLKNVKFENGLILDNIEQTIGQLSNDLNAETNSRINADQQLSNKIDIEKLERQNADDILSVEFVNKINYETERSIIRDNDLNDKLSIETIERISSDNDILSIANNKILHDRHLEMHVIDNREFPLNIKDYAINTYVDSNANAYVYKNGNLDSNPIGKIEKAKYNTENVLTSFEFNAFANHPDTYELTAAGRFQYYFDKDTTIQYTGIGGYRLNCDVSKSTTLQDTQFILDSANNEGFYRVYFSDSSVPAGIINANYKATSAGMISSCTFSVTNKQLSNFIRPVPFTFTDNGQSLVFIGTDGKTCEATLSDNVFYLYEQHNQMYYLPVRDKTDNTINAKIYDGNIKLDDEGQLNELIIDFVNGKKISLTKANEFKSSFDSSKPYSIVSYDVLSNIIQIKDDIKYYKYSFNNEKGTLTPGLADIPNKKIDDVYDTVGVTLTLGSEYVSKYVNKDYILYKDTYSNTYTVEEEITQDNFGKIKITFIKDEYAAFVDITLNGSADTIHLTLNINNIVTPTVIDRSTISFESLKLCEDICHVTQSEKLLDDKFTTKYILKPDLSKIEYSGEKKVLISTADTSKKDTLKLQMPNKAQQIPYDYNTASSKFILNFKIYTESLQDSTLVKLDIVSNDTVDKFYYMNKPVKNIYVMKNKWTTLQFNEIRPHRYVINDLDYSEINWKLDQLKDHISAAEFDINVLSDKVEFLLSTDREGIALKGTMLSANEHIAYDLSRYMYNTLHDQEYFLKQGFMYAISANHFFKAAEGTGEITNFFGAGDYFILNKNRILKDIDFDDINIIRNGQAEFEYLSVWTSCNFFNRYSDNYLSGNNTFDGQTSANNLNVADIEINVGSANKLVVLNEIVNSEYAFNLSVSSLENIKLIDKSVRPDPYNPELVTYISSIQDVLDLSTNTIEKEILDLSSSLNTTTRLSVEELQNQIVSNDNDIEFLSSDVRRISSEVSNVVKLSVEELQNQIVSNDTDISEVSVKVDFLLSVDHETVNYKGILPYYYNPEYVPEAQFLSDFIKPLIDESLHGRLKLGDLFKLSATQSALYDTDGKVNYYGKDDFFIINKDTVLTSIKNADLDIFRNAQTETEWLSSALCAEIEKLSTVLSNEIDNLSTALSNEINNISTSISNTVKLSVEDLQNQIVLNDNDIEFLSSYVDSLELSVNGISVEVDRISAELSTELNNCELSVSGLSIEVDRISTELSNELNRCELSVNGLSNYIDDLELSVNGLSVRTSELCAELSIAHNFLSNSLSDEIEKLSTSLSNTTKLSVEQLCSEIIANDNDISYLSSTLDFVLSTGHDTVAYQGTMQYYDPQISPTIIDRSLSAFINKSLNAKYNKHLKYGFMFKLSAVQDMLSDEYEKTTYFGAEDFFIVNKNVKNVEHIHVEDLDIIRNAMSETIRLSTELSTELCACELSVNGLSIEVDRISTELSNELNRCELSVSGLSIEVDRISTELSNELNRCELSVNGLSNYIDDLELSVNGLSVRTSELCAELSDMLQLSVDELQRQVVSNDNDISTISSDLSVLQHHYYDKTMSCDIVLSHDLNTPGHPVTDHISAVVDKLLIVDEATFDLYALTIRNGALNINKVKTIDHDYHVDCCAKK